MVTFQADALLATRKPGHATRELATRKRAKTRAQNEANHRETPRHPQAS